MSTKAVKNAILFLLGVVLILDAVFGRGALDRVIEIAVGLILIGILPIDQVLDRLFGRGAATRANDQPPS